MRAIDCTKMSVDTWPREPALKSRDQPPRRPRGGTALGRRSGGDRRLQTTRQCRSLGEPAASIDAQNALTLGATST
jgi:hypothetical protein